jgi:hypothetical protein
MTVCLHQVLHRKRRRLQKGLYSNRCLSRRNSVLDGGHSCRRLAHEHVAKEMYSQIVNLDAEYSRLMMPVEVRRLQSRPMEKVAEMPDLPS